MKRTVFIVALAILGCAVVSGYVAYDWLLGRLLSAHQQSTTKEIAAWGETYSKIESPEDAGRAAEMMGYIRNYYVVAPGYRSDSPTDTALENQRRETIERINAALRKYEEANGNKD